MMKKIAVILSCLALAGCELFFEGLDPREGALLPIPAVNPEELTDEELQYLQAWYNCWQQNPDLDGNPLMFEWLECLLIINDDNFNFYLMGVPALDKVAIGWGEEGSGKLFAGRDDTLLSLTTTWANGPEFEPFYDRDEPLKFNMALSFEDGQPSTEESFGICMPYLQISNGSRLSITSEWNIQGRDLTLESETNVRNFTLDGPHQATLDRISTTIISEGMNRLGTRQGEQNVTVRYKANGAPAGFYVNYERVTTEWINGVTESSVARFDSPGLNLFPADLSISMPRYTATVTGKIWQGGTPVAVIDPSDFDDIKIEQQIMHYGRSPVSVNVGIGTNGSNQMVEGYSCRVMVEESVSINNQSVGTNTLEQAYLGVDTLSFFPFYTWRGNGEAENTSRGTFSLYEDDNDGVAAVPRISLTF
ncbi:MAG: hypothetical protein AAF699_15615 [Pseudomonadota bacterium]